MLFRERILRKIFVIFLALLLVLNPVVAPLVWAEGEEEVYPEGTEGPAEEQVAQDEEPQEESQGEGDSTITTGDAESQAEVETTANTNQDTIAGEITTPPGDCTPPEGETSCPEDIVIENDNLADVSDSATSSATTGDNQITGSSGDATIETGDATASGTIENEINSNTVILEPAPTPSIEPEITPTTTPTPTPSPEEQTLTVENSNEGTLTNQADVSASTGENLASQNLGDATIETGNALAWANLLNLLNTNILGSNFEVLFLDLINSENGDINLNELWKQILEANGGDSLVLADGSTLSNLQILVQNQNQANLANNVNVGAGTGENQANENEGDASIETGEATALANVTNIVNTNILGSQFFFGVINVLGSFEGNLILPRPEMFAPQAYTQGIGAGAVFENQNEAEIEDEVMSLAETGANEEINNQGDNLIETGDATAVANTFSLVNLNIFRNNWFFLIINNLGRWSGKIFGWAAPSALDEPSQGSQVYQVGLNEPIQEVYQDVQIGNDLPLLSFQNQNQATVRNNIQTLASTGQNQANENQGNASIQTGNANSLANLFNFINLNILGGRWFIGLVNVLGNWSGNTIFAYPDVTVNLTNGLDQAMVGETVEYTLSYKNQGYDEAGDVVIGFELPDGVSFLGDSSGLTVEISGQTYSWFLGMLGAGEEGAFTITVMINPDFSFEEPLTFWSKIIPQAHAVENEKEGEVLATASIGTGDPESDLSNNTSSVKTLVYLPLSPQSESQEEGVDQRQPVLEISAWNNVGEFVYPGDTVAFEITVKNVGEVPSYETYLLQTLYNGVPEDFGVARFELGTIEPGKGGKLSFGMVLADDGLLPGGHYYTIAQAFGKAPNGNEVSSNEARTDFEIRLKEVTSLFEAKAVGKEEEILGAAACPECKQEEDILPYVLLLILSSMWLTNWGKIRLRKK